LVAIDGSNGENQDPLAEVGIGTVTILRRFSGWPSPFGHT